MSDGLEKQVEKNTDRIEDLEDLAVVTNHLIERVGEIKGKLDLVADQVTAHLTRVEKAVNGVGTNVDKANSLKTALQFAAVIVVPVLVALIGGYFALKAGLSQHPTPAAK